MSIRNTHPNTLQIAINSHVQRRQQTTYFQQESGWKKPVPPWIKCNVDGSALGKPGPAGVGGIFRDCKGDTKAVFSSNIGAADSNIAEFMAIVKAFEVFLSLPDNLFPFLAVESDSAVATSWAMEKDDVPWTMISLKRKLTEFKNKVAGWSITKIQRSDNVAADALAKAGVGRGQNLLLFF